MHSKIDPSCQLPCVSLFLSPVTPLAPILIIETGNTTDNYHLHVIRSNFTNNLSAPYWITRHTFSHIWSSFALIDIPYDTVFATQAISSAEAAEILFNSIESYRKQQKGFLTQDCFPWMYKQLTEIGVHFGSEYQAWHGDEKMLFPFDEEMLAQLIDFLGKTVSATLLLAGLLAITASLVSGFGLIAGFTLGAPVMVAAGGGTAALVGGAGLSFFASKSKLISELSPTPISPTLV